MKKALYLAILGVFLVGCSTNNSPTANYSYRKDTGGISLNEVRNGVAPAIIEGKVVTSDACANRNAPMCKSFADSMYGKGDFTSAIVAYNANCAGSMHIPSCMKMAHMFEKGEGVAQNINNAIDLYMRSCYHGDSQGCKNMRRLGYKG